MNDYLYHHGILGQKWGVRRYQNADGILTAEGKTRYYDKQVKKNTRKAVKNAARAGIASAMIGGATTGAGYIANVAGISGSITRGLATALGSSYLEAAASGAHAAASTAAALAGMGSSLLTATTVVGLASAGFAVYRTAKAINAEVKKRKAEKE